jgi:hypothetical protein
LVRLAELEFSFGYSGKALQHLEEGLQRSPRNAQGAALKGFCWRRKIGSLKRGTVRPSHRPGRETGQRLAGSRSLQNQEWSSGRGARRY